MKIKSIILTSIAFVSCISNVKAQLTISSGAVVNIQSGAVITVQGDVTSSADITGAGKLLLKGTLAQNVNMNGNVIPNLEIDNAANTNLTGNIKIGTEVIFTTGKILQNNFDLTINNTATITGAGATKYFVTNGTGKLIKANLGATPFVFPVGNTATSYNPTTIGNSGTADDIGVRCLTNVMNLGTTGTTITKEVADVSWDVSEALAGGSNLSLSTSWNGTDELAGFNRAKSGISYYIPTAGTTLGWDLLNSQTSAATGADPYNYTRTGISSLGIFAVGNRPVLSPLLVSPKVFLQGPYNVGAGLMTDGLRTVTVSSLGTTDATHGVIPETEPYTGLSGFTHTATGSGGGEKITPGVFGVFNVPSNDAIVDWAFVQIHDGTTGTVVGTRSALIQRDGDVVETDGISPVNMAGFPAANYYISVRHRNHLGVRTAGSSFALAKTITTPYNFTSAQTQAFPGGVANNPMATLTASTVFGMWGGDASGNRIVRFSGGGNDQNQLLNTTLGGNTSGFINGTYNRSDLNMNGRVSFSGGANDQNILLNTVLGGLTSTILTQPTF